MDAVEYLKALGRLCNDYLCGDNCPLIDICHDASDDGYVRKVQIVEQWAKEHPVKTRQSEFLKMFPSALIDGGSLCICPKILDSKTYSTDTGCNHIGSSITCRDCRRDFWLKEIE